MKLSEVLAEEFYEYFSNPNYMKTGHYPVFKDPSKKEMKEASELSTENGVIRFIADLKEKDVFVFQNDILHHVVKKNIFNKNDRLAMFGLAIEKSGKWYASFTEFIGPGMPSQKGKKYYEAALKLDLSWMEEYFEMTDIYSSFMSRYKEKK